MGAKLNCTALDVSAEALKVARSNARANKVKIHFQKSDLLATTKTLKKDALITANLPYLTRPEMSEPSIAHEPKLALLGGGKDGIGFSIKNSSHKLATRTYRTQWYCLKSDMAKLECSQQRQLKE